jgi:hypothetical protein
MPTLARGCSRRPASRATGRAPPAPRIDLPPSAHLHQAIDATGDFDLDEMVSRPGRLESANTLSPPMS